MFFTKFMEKLMSQGRNLFQSVILKKCKHTVSLVLLMFEEHQVMPVHL